MESKFTRYGKEKIQVIEENLCSYPNASQASKDLGIDVSGLIKHIKKYRKLKLTSDNNKCALRFKCNIKNKACGDCFYLRMYNQEKSCSSCKSNCNATCSSYTLIPDCERLNKWPYVCNGCIKKDRCRLNKYIYSSEDVWKETQKNRSETRKGAHANEEEFVRLSKILIPLLKDKHQSLPQIYLTHKTELRWSYVTLLSYIDNGLIPGVKNIDLTKRVVYPEHYKKENNEPTNIAFLTNRTYSDFISYVTDNNSLEIVEMDTVIGKKGTKPCLLTMLFRKSNYMLAFLLPNKKAESVRNIFIWIRNKLGDELYANTFPIILTDNGTEFARPYDIEFTTKVNKAIHLFYCDPGNSGQKGKIEKNHVELRKIFPKGTDFSIYSQTNINLALKHINSEPRKILNGNCPGKIASVFIDEKVLSLNDYSFINPDEVVLHPDLFKK